MLLENFYTTARRGNCSGDAGAFGFDVHFALEVDYLVTQYGCDAIVETGTNFGDTAEYLARQYPHLPIVTCEINPVYFALARERLRPYPNVEIYLSSSEKVVQSLQTRFRQAFYYLDAHWEAHWPLGEEISSIEQGVVCVGDFFIGPAAASAEVFYGFDSYNGAINDQEYVKTHAGADTEIYVNNALNPGVYPYVCLQRQRRSGRAYFVQGSLPQLFDKSQYFVSIR
jgi:predicted O-methyltransferase YrrM